MVRSVEVHVEPRMIPPLMEPVVYWWLDQAGVLVVSVSYRPVAAGDAWGGTPVKVPSPCSGCAG